MFKYIFLSSFPKRILKINSFTKKLNSSTHKKITPEEIRNTIRLMRINNLQMNFSQYDKYNQWHNPNEAIDIFNEYLNYFNLQFKIDYLTNSAVFDELKLLLKNLQTKQENINNTYFYHTLIILLRKLYIENFKKTNFITNNIQYCLRSFVFLKTIVEHEFLVADLNFMNDFFSIINECSNIYIEKLYTENINIFIKNYGIMEEFLTRFLNITSSKYIIAYNPKFYNFHMEIHLEKIFKNFENLILHFVINQKPEILADRIKEIASVISKRRISSEKIVDYINMFLVSHKFYLNIFYLIEILDNLSVYRQCINYEILNHFYNCLITEINTKNLMNFPKDYLINSIKIISQNHMIGSFNIIEQIVEVLKNKVMDDLNLNEIIDVVISCLRSGYNEKKVIDYFLNMIYKHKMLDEEKSGLNYNNIKNLKTLMDRFITEKNYVNEELFEYIYLHVNIKFENLKIFKNNYNNNAFIEFVKNDFILAKTDFIEEIITEEDFIKYHDISRIIICNCLFKLNKNYEISSQTTIDFYNDNDKHTIINFLE